MKKHSFYFKFLISLGLVLINILLPSLAMAQSTSSGFFTVPSTDVAKTQFIDYLAGPLDGGSSSPFGNVIGIFNGAILILGGIYLLYIYIAGTAQGAHDGQFLGQRWSTLWVPIRMLIGSVLAFPSLTGGFCLAQWLVIWLTLQGVGFADQIWTAYAGNPLGGMVINPVNNAAIPYNIARQVFLNNVCIDLFNQAVGQNVNGASALPSDEQNSIKSLLGNTQFLITPATITNGVGVINYAMQSGNSSFYNFMMGDSTGQSADAMGVNPSSVCGSASLNAPQISTQSSASSTSTSTGWVGSTTYTTLQTNLQQNQQDLATIANAFNTVHAAQLNQIQSAMKQQADTFVANPNTSFSSIDNAIQASATGYQQSLAQTLSSVQGQMASMSQSFQQQITSDGFIMAGAYYMKIAKMQDTISSSMNNYPVVSGSRVLDHVSMVTGGTGIHKDMGVEDDNQALMDMLKDQVWGPYHLASRNSVNVATENSAYDTSLVGANNTGDNSVTDLVNKITSSEDINPNDIFGTLGLQDNSNPLFLAHDIGVKMVNWAWIILGVGLVGGFFSSGVAMLAMSLWLALVVPGATLTTAIPMLPFIIWMGSVFSWFVLLIEALIAAPIWAIAHLSPEGDGFQGSARSGYMILLNLTLRPALMIFGLIAAIIAMQPIGQLINTTYGLAFNNAIGGTNSFNRITSLIAGCGIYAIMMLSTTKKVFELIHVVPDRVMRWMGGGDGLQHDLGHTGAEAMAAKAIQGAHAVGGEGIRATQGLAQGAAKKLQTTFGKMDGPNGSGGGSPASLASSLQQRADIAHEKSLGSSSPSKYEDSARAHSKAANGHLKNALDQDPTLNSQYKKAQQDDADSRSAGQPANAVNDLLDSKVLDAQYDQGSGKTLTPSQESLLAMQAAKNNESEALIQANKLRGSGEEES
jgi:conjugal transfer/type IV secretion protein DotA/TraY